jgi:hypothetical protein
MLVMLPARVIHYFSGGYSAMNLPYPVNPVITVYVSPMLFFERIGISGLRVFYLEESLKSFVAPQPV